MGLRLVRAPLCGRRDTREDHAAARGGAGASLRVQCFVAASTSGTDHAAVPVRRRPHLKRCWVAAPVPARSRPTIRSMSTVTLWGPVGQAELDLIEQTRWTRFAPRLPDSRSSRPVLNEEYATKVARDGNTKGAARATSATCCASRSKPTMSAGFEPQRVDGAGIDELWVPVAE